MILDTHNPDIGQTWTQVAADGVAFLLAVAGPGVLEVAATAADAEPAEGVVAGYELARMNRESLSRADLPVGFLWARAQPSGAVTSIKAVLTTWAE